MKSFDDYATILFELSGIQDTGIVVQLLSSNDQMVQQVRADANGTADFPYVAPGKYYVRAFVDRNGNNLWDTGEYDADLQPEDVYYYPHEIETKSKFDITQRWNLTQVKRNAQKPSQIVKQKPDKQKRQQRNRNAERARQLGIESTKKTMVE